MKLRSQHRLELAHSIGSFEHAYFYEYEEGVWVEATDWDRKLYPKEKAREIYRNLLNQGFRKWNW